jgi:hypothetical protein
VNPKKLVIPPEHIEREFWYRGLQRYMLHEHSQRKMYEKTLRWKEKNPDLYGPVVWNCHRGFGKSFTKTIIGLERCSQAPRQIVRFGTESEVAALEIIKHQLEPMLDRRPKDFKVELSNDTWHIQNPRWGKDEWSELHIFGCRENARKHRGKRSDLVLMDEGRNIEDLEYVMRSVFGPHFVTRDKPLAIIGSTPPDTPDHAYSSVYIPEAIEGDRYFICRATDNPDIREQDLRMMIDGCGGEESVHWRREGLCELVADDARRVVAEWKQVRDTCFVDHWPRPEHFFPRVFIDVGWEDKTALLYGYHDFHSNKLVIEREYVASYKTAAEIAEMSLAIEWELWGDTENYHHVTRVADADKWGLETLRKDQRFHCRAAERWDRDGTVNQLRSRVQREQVVVHRECKILDSQLTNSIWNRRRNNIQRDMYGHFDAGMALAYGASQISWRVNPDPESRVNDDDLFVRPNRQQREPGGAIVTRRPLRVTRRSAHITRR